MKINEIISCPVCHKDLNFKTASGGYECSQCKKTYPCSDAIIDFYPEYRKAKKWAQKVMESERIVNIYETDKFRDSKMMSAKMFGISLKDEMAMIKSIINPGNEDNILDLACGPGIYARSLAGVCTQGTVIGYDLSRPMLRYASIKAQQENLGNITFMHGDAHNLPFRDAVFDIVVCCGALHNFTHVRQVLAEIGRTLKTGGRLALAVGYRKDSFPGRSLGWISDTFFHVHLFTENELVHLLEETNIRPSIHHTTGTWMIAGGNNKSI